MKYLIFIILITMYLSGNSYSQTDTTNIKKWEVGIYVGAMIPESDFMRQFDISPNVSLEIGYNFNSRFSTYLNSTYNFIKTPYSNYPGFHNNITTKLIEVKTGLRYNFSKTLPRFFTDAGIGFYNFRYLYEDGFWETHVQNINNLGFHGDLGLELPTYKNIILSFSFRYTYILLTDNYSDATYYGIRSGIKYMF